MDFPTSSSRDWARYQSISDSGTSRYSGPEPQILPLPPELTVRILSFLDRAYDKKSARLVCRGFAAAGLPSLTSTAYFSTSLLEMRNSSKNPPFSHQVPEIAMHPVVSKYVTRLVFCGSRLPPSCFTFSTFQDWWVSLGKNHTTRLVDYIHRVYTSTDYAERLMANRGEDRTIFCKALEQFLNLKCIVITDVAANEGRRDYPRPPWPSEVPEMDFWSPSSPYYNFALCIRSLSEMGIKLHELHIKGRQNAIPYGVFTQASPKDRNHMSNVFVNLRKISVNVSPQQDTNPANFGNFAALGRHVIQATMLQSLDLNCVGKAPRHSKLHLLLTFENATWPHLKHFGLQGFSMHTDAHLIAFFVRHRATIDSVRLESLYLHEKDPNSTDESPCEAWKHFFDELRRRSIKFQNLYLFRIQDCRNHGSRYLDLTERAQGGDRVLQFLRDGGPNPLVRRRA